MHVYDVPNLFKVKTGNSDGNTDLEKGSGDESPPRAGSFAPASLSFFPGRTESIASSTDTVRKHQRNQSHSSASIFYPPSFIRPSLSISSPTFASLTQVQDPLVRRAQWETVVTAAAYGIFGAGLMTGTRSYFALDRLLIQSPSQPSASPSRTGPSEVPTCLAVLRFMYSVPRLAVKHVLSFR